MRYAKCRTPKPLGMSAEHHAGHELLESRMMRKYHVRFGGGRLEKGLKGHLASRLPNSAERLTVRLAQVQEKQQ